MKIRKFISTVICLSTLLCFGAGCSGEAAETTTTTTADTTVAETTSAPETTTAETTTVTEAEELSEYFTTTADGKTSMSCFTCEGDKGAWAHLINPYNEVSLFMPMSPGDMEADTENLVICFNVSGVTEEMTAFCGLMAYGTCEDDEELSVWNNDTYKTLTGEDFEFVIAEDGYYEMIVPIAKLAGGLDFWEGLSYTSIIEVAFFGAEGIDEAGEYTKALKDGLAFEFLGIRAE
ncbi:MAG: hypothetical protein IJ385_00330 [Ruminiclostridium sp.]|nr:hypothetical protein [Ruminiclostridium sp.]